MRDSLFFLLLGLIPTLVPAWPRSRQKFLQEPPTNSLFRADSQLSTPNSSFVDLRERQDVLDQSTCGYNEGDPNQPRTAGPGFNCRFDTLHALWGFCPTTVIAATDCGLAGNCVDSHACSSGCGITGTPGITTFTCSQDGAGFCSSVLLTAGPDLVFSYIACGPTAATAHLLAQPTEETSTTSKTSTTPAAPTSTPPATTVTPTTQSRSSSSSRVATTSPASLRSSSSSSIEPSLSSPASSDSSSSTPIPVSGSEESSSGTTTQGSSPSSSSSPSPSGSNNLGAIIGGVVGGLAVICIFVLGVLFLRRYRRGQNEEGGSTSKRNTWWKGGYRTTEMQTAGLHEKDAEVPVRHEAEGSNVPEKYSSEPQGLGIDGSAPRRHTAFELPS